MNKFKTLKNAINDIDFASFKHDYCSDDALDLNDLSVKYNLSVRNCERYAEHFKLKRSKIFIANKKRKTCIDKYGVDNVMKRDDYKEKNRQTIINKYGVDNVFKSELIKEKIKESNLKRYGVEYPQQNYEIRAKSFKTCIERYGSKNNIAKIKKTNLSKYGVENVSKSQDVIDKINQTAKDKYGVETMCQSDKCRFAPGSRNSKINKQFAKLLDDYNISYEREFNIGKKSFDFKITGTDTLIEIDPSITHNVTMTSPNFKRTKIYPEYHLDKSTLALNNNMFCIHVFDWDDKNKIVQRFSQKAKLYARLCTVKNVSKFDCDTFLNKYHLQGTCNKQTIRLGLYYKDELVELMTFGKPRYNKQYQYELLRLCSSFSYNIVGGSKKLFKYFIDNYNPTSIISYCDNSKFEGTVYSDLKFKKKSKGEPSRHWYNLKTNQHITDNLLRQHGFDQLFKTNYGKGTLNDDLMRQHGFVEIYDCGQSTWAY